MAQFTVTTTADVVDASDGVLSLREALAQADAAAGDDEVDFAASVQGQAIVLAGSQLTVASNVRVSGGLGVTIDANGQSRVLETQGSGNLVQLDHLTVTGGLVDGDEGGGGILAASNLTLQTCNVRGNATQGLDGDGGGIRATGGLQLFSSTVSGNSTVGAEALGGGISLGGYALVTLDNSTVAANNTRGLEAHGGGIYAGAGVNLQLTSTTVTGNSAHGLLAYGSGITSHERLSLTNSIVAGNATDDIDGAINASNGHNVLGVTGSGAAAGDATNVDPATVFSTGDLADNGGFTPTVALLDSLTNPALGHADPASLAAADQRGAIRPGPANTTPDIGAFELAQTLPSFAVDAIDADKDEGNSGTTEFTFTISRTADTDLAFDVHYVVVGSGDHPADAGDFGGTLPSGVVSFAAGETQHTIAVGVSGDLVREANEGFAVVLGALDNPSADGTILNDDLHATLTVTTAADVVDAGDGAVSLREALALAAGVPGADRIEFAAGVQGHTITLTQGQLTVTSDIAIDGGTAGVTIDAAQRSRVIEIDGNSTHATLSHLTISGGRTIGDGVDRADGAGIYAAEGFVLIDSCTIVGNHATGANSGGGGVGVGRAQTRVTNCTISGNYSDYAGGGLFGDYLSVSDSTITGNTVLNTGGIERGGGGIYGICYISNSIVAGNVSPQYADVSRDVTSRGNNVFGSHVDRSVASDLQNIDAQAIFQHIKVLPVTGIHAGVLADNGGPTATVALLDGAANPALAHAAANTLTTDQRGEPRPAPAGSSPDSGAFELQETPNIVAGSDLRDHLVGTRADDLLQGGAGNDHLAGGRAGDRLEGGDGIDRLRGGGGGDLLDGGEGADRFVFSRPTHSNGIGRDVILDFAPAEGDRIDLHRLDAHPFQPGDQRLTFIGTDAFGAAGQVHYVAEPGWTLLEVNLDRDSKAEVQIHLQPDLVLHRADFVL